VTYASPGGASLPVQKFTTSRPSRSIKRSRSFFLLFLEQGGGGLPGFHHRGSRTKRKFPPQGILYLMDSCLGLTKQGEAKMVKDVGINHDSCSEIRMCTSTADSKGVKVHYYAWRHCRWNKILKYAKFRYVGF
jgi:hypothetical protein